MAITPLQTDLENFFNGLCCPAPTPGVYPNIFYTVSTSSGYYTFDEGQPITTFCPSTLTGTLPITVTVTPSLPSGLTLDPVTGCVSGTPTSISTLSSYDFVATNYLGNSNYVMQIEVLNQFITITNGGFGTTLAAQTYLDLYSTTYTDFSYDSVNDIMSWKEPANTSYTTSNFMRAGINGLATGATFSDQKGLITSFLGLGSFNFISTDHTFANNITFGNNTFNGLASNVILTFGNDCSFGERSLSSPSGTNNTINFGDNCSFNAATDMNLDGFDNSTFNFKNINNIVTRLGVTADCTYNFNGSIGSTTGVDFTNPDWIDATSINPTINARTFDQTSNGGGVEGDLDNLTNNGFTVNFIL
jgi:hypothetical protein